MVFDNFTLGSSLNSSNNEILDSYVDNNKLYVLQNSNIIIYDINVDLASSNTLTTLSNIPLNTNEYFFIKESNMDITLYTKNLKDKLTIYKSTNNYRIDPTNIQNVSNLNITKDGFNYKNETYIIHNTGKSIRNITTNNEYNISTTVTNFKSLSDNNIIHIRLNNIVYVIVSDQDCIIKWNIDTKLTTKIIIINDYQIVKRKFSKAIYSNITNKIYLIPYNIIELIVIDVAKDTIEFIQLSGLTNLKIKAFFSTAVENQGYIYMIPNTLNFIYVFNIYENKIINIMDISSFNGILNESSKFIDAYMFTDSIRKRIFALPNKSNKLGLIDYDLGVGAVLESTANFNILSSSLFTPNLNGVYSLDNVLELGTNTFYTSTYTRGTTNFNLYSENSSNIFEWRPKNAITMTTNNFLSNIKTIDAIKYFQDDNNKNIFEIYKAPSTAIIYSPFEANDFLSNNRINTVSINNIYSIENNTVYFIPYNFKSLIALELNNDISQPPILKLLDITKNSDTNVTKFKDFMNNITGRFNCSIIVNQKLYMVPYIDSDGTSDNIIPFVIYDFVKNKTRTNIVNIVIKDLKTLLNTSDLTFIGTQLFCTVLFYTSDNSQYLFLIHKNANFSIFYTISDSNDDINNINILGSEYTSGYSDGCIIGDKIYLLDKTQINIYIYDIEILDTQTVNFNYNKTINLLYQNITDKYSKMLYYEYGNTLYLIPYNANKIGRIRNIGITYNFDEIDIVASEYSIDEQLFKGGTLLTLNNKTYILMVPYNSKKLYLYNITDPGFTYIEDPIFKNNKFVDCTVDIKGNIYFNTYDGSILYYVLSVEKFYTIPRLPVLSKTEISFKDIYKKFHKDFIYDKYNYNNKQIKFSDYFNKGGTTYYTVANVEENKFIIDDNNLVSNVNSKTTPNITYKQFTALQSNVQLNIQNYKKVKSQRYEYYDVYDGTKSYTIDSVNIAPNNAYIYYVKKYNNRIALYDENTLIDATITGNIGDYSIPNINPGVLLTLEIDLNSTTIYDRMNNTDGIKDYTKVRAFLKKGLPFSGTVVFDTAYFIKHGITDGSTPKETMNILSTVLFEINGTINKGLTINIDGLDRSYTDMDTYLRALNIIEIKISTTGIINYADNKKSLIILTNPRDLVKPLLVRIYEEITKYELYLTLTGSINTALTDLKINKLTLVISNNTPITINIDLYSNLIYLKEIIVLINVTYTSTLTFTSITNNRHNLNIIVYDNA